VDWSTIGPLVGVLIGAYLQGIYNRRAKRDEYVNDYYKRVIERRVAAYERLEKFIMRLRTSFVGPDGRNCSFLFVEQATDSEGAESASVALYDVVILSLWLSNDVTTKVREFDSLISPLGSDPQAAVEFGKKNYQAIDTIGAELQRLLARDMLSLHDVEGFLKSKDKADPGFHPLRL
jgi:hypothetical protein